MSARTASKTGVFASGFVLAISIATTLAVPTPAKAIVELGEIGGPQIEADFREGNLLPEKAATDLVKTLGATANWNRFGTVNSLVKRGGYLAQGLKGTPVEAARSWIKANRSLFKLSETGVDALELVNEGVTPYNAARAVLFRQRFGGLASTHDGLITVGVVDGKVYYVSSSSAGDQPPPGAATLTPLQAWLIAAADVNRKVSPSDVVGIKDLTKTTGWMLMNVTGFSQPQRARLVAIPIPAGGVRQAYETIVLDSQGSIALGWVHFVDAQTGKILRRENRLNNQSTSGTNSTPYQTAFPDATTCTPKTDFPVAAGAAQIVVVAASAQPANDISINLYLKVGPTSTLVAHNDLLTSPETLMYAPTGGVPPGTYEVEVCPFGTALPPLDVVGTFTTSDQAGSAAALLPPPRWKWFSAYPSPNYTGEDNRLLGCWLDGTGCQIIFNNLAAKQQWDVMTRTGLPSMTTIGNAAMTAEAWGSPLTPAEMYRPVSAMRDYEFTYGDVWNKSKCDPTNLVPMGNDINASVTNLFVIHNRMHDWSYYLGFTELNYNLQTSNFGQTDVSREGDPELGNVQAGAISGAYASPSFYTAPGRDNANQIALQDGVPGITNQYLFQSLPGILYSPCADGDFDMSVVGHEYTHAISNRMIGGPDQSIGGQQGGSMGESWSDLDATEYLMAFNFIPVADESPTAIGAYATGDKKIGIRDYALDDTPLNYGNLGFDTPGAEVHSDGEIWNAVNWDIRTALVAKYESTFPYGNKVRQKDCADGKYPPDTCPGNRRWIQIIFDSFLLMPATPSMLDARDSMLAADVARFDSANQVELWHAFAVRGMGVDAYTADSNDTGPVPNFESPLETPATVSFSVTAEDETGAAITNAKVYVGKYATRTRPVADTDPTTVVDTSNDAMRRSTLNHASTARMIPGTYDFVIEAAGYGIHSFRRTVNAGDNAIAFSLPTNYASMTKGATVLTSATVAANIALANTLIDDSENTGARFGDVAPIKGAYAIVMLAGGAHSISHINVSTAAGPDNPGRYTGVRKFEVLVCSGTCADPVSDFTKVAFTSPDDAFPGKPLRPLQPDLIMRSFDFAPVSATHVMLRAVTNQCTGQPLFAGDTDNDPTVSADCPSFVPPPQSGVNVLGMTVTNPVAPASVVRATEFEVFGHAPANVDAGTTTGTTTGTATGGTTGTTTGGTSGGTGGGTTGTATGGTTGGSTGSTTGGSIATTTGGSTGGTTGGVTDGGTTGTGSDSRSEGRRIGGGSGFGLLLLLPALLTGRRKCRLD